MAGMYSAPPKAIQTMREEVERKVKLATRNLNFLRNKTNISVETLANNANIDYTRLTFIFDLGDGIFLDEFLRLVQTLNEMCGLNFSIIDYITIEF